MRLTKQEIIANYPIFDNRSNIVGIVYGDEPNHIYDEKRFTE